MNDLAAPGQEPQRFQEGEGVKLGQWYWVKYDKGTEDDDQPRPMQWFGCVMELGSNYFELKSVAGGEERIHVDVFFKRCTQEKDPRAIINGQVLRFKGEVEGYLGEIRELTARLGVSPTTGIEQQEDTRALSTRNATDADMKAYKKTLIKAKEKTLPDLFEKVEESNKSLARWMSADVLTVKSQLGNLEKYVEVVEERIFHVELYAGLTEEIEQIQDGEPAAIGERLRLMQGRLYMDEECLIDYDAGGMEFKNIRAFDKWLLRPHNLSALLPFPRCMVAFQVRRKVKEREESGISYGHKLEQIQLEMTDKFTYLYIRNGAKVYRLSTEIDLREKLFPDTSEFDFSEPLMANTAWGKVEKIITRREYDARVKKEADTAAELKIQHAQWMKDNKAKYTKKGRTDDDYAFWSPFRHNPHSFDEHHFTPFDHSNVKYDDIKASIEADMKYYNRVVLILQGLLDRSPVFHPHPPAQLWNHSNFDSLVQLVYDRDRALYAGEKPDFEAFRAQCNALLAVGSVVVGMRKVWKNLPDERVKLYDRRGEPYYRYEPYPDPGPAYLTTVTAVKGDRVTIEYVKPRQRRVLPNKYSLHAVEGMDAGDPMTVKLTAKRSQVFNASAYTPGDYKMFFSDPRTRADYLKWAPLLLAAEDFRAGKRKVDEPQ